MIDDIENSIRKTTNREEANKLIEELDNLTLDTPAEVVDDMLRRTRDFSPLKVETLLALMTMRIGRTRSDLHGRRRELLHSTSSTDPVDTIRGNSIDMVLLDEAQNWPTQRDGDTITHGSVTGRATSPTPDVVFVSPPMDIIDLNFSTWWQNYLRDFDNIPPGPAIDKMKVAFRAGYIRGVKDAKKDGA